MPTEQRQSEPARIALIELQYLPPVQTMSKWLLYDEIWIEQHEHYLKRSYRNRCALAGANGLLELSIPLKSGKNEQQPIREVHIANEERWQAHHWAAIQSAYGKAPFFEFYVDELKPFYEQTYRWLFDYNYELLSVLVDQIGLPGRQRLTSRFEHHPPQKVIDLRQQITPRSRQERNAAFRAVAYPQVFEEKHGFLPNLSVLDLLFCCGPQSLLLLEQCIVHP